MPASELQVGMKHSLEVWVSEAHTTRRLLPESEEFQRLPVVLATGYMVGILEWACKALLTPYLEPGENSVGTSINVTHEAATIPDTMVTVDAELVTIDGRMLTFEVVARDDLAVISRGTHGRAIINQERFDARLAERAAAREGAGG